MGLPYRWSAMRIDARHGERSYRCRRLAPQPSVASSVRVVATSDPVEQTELDRFLTARFRLYGDGPLGPFVVPVEHAPWQLFHAHAADVDDGLVPAAGLPPPTDPPLVHRGADVAVRIGLASLLGDSWGPPPLQEPSDVSDVSPVPRPSAPTRRSDQGPRPTRPAAANEGASALE